MSERIQIAVDMGEGLEPFELPNCKHMEFAAQCNVNRVVRTEGFDPHTFMLDVKVICLQCGELLRFRGTPHAITFRHPARTWAGTELSAPMEPSGDYDLDWLDTLRAQREERPNGER